MSEEDYQNILESEKGDIFYLTEPEISKVMELQAKTRLTPVAQIGEMRIYEVSSETKEY